MDDLQILAPCQIPGHWQETTAFGAAVWLFMHSPQHVDAPLHTLQNLLLPAIRSRQFVLLFRGEKPVAYAAWARFSTEAEQRYLTAHPATMPEQDWASGQRYWLLDVIAPFGHIRQLTRVLRQLLAGHCVRSLYHKGDATGLRVMQLASLMCHSRGQYSTIAAPMPRPSLADGCRATRGWLPALPKSS